MPPSASKSPMRGISRWRDMIRTGASRSAGNCRSVPDRHADPRARRVERFGERIKFALLALDARREDVKERDRLAAEGRPVGGDPFARPFIVIRSEEHTSELQSLMRSSYAAFCLKK